MKFHQVQPPTMNRLIVSSLVVLCVAAPDTLAFAVGRESALASLRVPPRGAPLKSGFRSGPGSRVLRMSEEEESKVKGQEGTYYDDEVEPAVKKEPLSDSMRARLMAEAGTGLDSEKKQTNVILYIMVVVAALVVLGGQGILY